MLNKIFNKTYIYHLIRWVILIRKNHAKKKKKIYFWRGKYIKNIWFLHWTTLIGKYVKKKKRKGSWWFLYVQELQVEPNIIYLNINLGINNNFAYYFQYYYYAVDIIYYITEIAVFFSQVGKNVKKNARILECKFYKRISFYLFSISLNNLF